MELLDRPLKDICFSQFWLKINMNFIFAFIDWQHTDEVWVIINVIGFESLIANKNGKEEDMGAE